MSDECGAAHPTDERVYCSRPTPCFEFHSTTLWEGAKREDFTWPGSLRKPSDRPRKGGLTPPPVSDTPVTAGSAEDAFRAHMAKQLQDPSRPGARLRGDHHDTEAGAAQLSNEKNGTWRHKVLTAIARAGEHGAIDFDIAEEIGLMAPRVATRRGELVTFGWIVDSGRRRLTGSGAEAIVWVLSPTGRTRRTEFL